MKKIFTFLFVIFSLSVSAQNIVNDKIKTSSISLSEYVENVKAQNESIKNAKSINVMVNDLLIENLNEYMIDPKNISKLEVLVLDSKSVNREKTKPSIIIYTKIK